MSGAVLCSSGAAGQPQGERAAGCSLLPPAGLGSGDADALAQDVSIATSPFSASSSNVALLWGRTA